MGFKIIETQEAFDEAIKERIDRINKKYEGYTSPEDLEALKKDYESQIESYKKFEGYTSPEELEKIKKGYEGYTSPTDLETIKRDYDAKINGLELDASRIKVAIENGLPYSLSQRLKGTNEEELNKDAQELSKYFTKNNAWPSAQSEPGNLNDDPKNAYRGIVKDLFNKD